MNSRTLADVELQLGRLHSLKDSFLMVPDAFSKGTSGILWFKIAMPCSLWFFSESFFMESLLEIYQALAETPLLIFHRPTKSETLTQVAHRSVA